MDLPTYVSLIAEQSRTHDTNRSIQSPVPPEASDEAENTKEAKLTRAQVENSADDTLKAFDADSYRPQTVFSSTDTSLIDSNKSSDVSPAPYVGDNAQQYDDSNAGESHNNNNEESDIAMPLSRSMDEESDDVPVNNLMSAYAHPALPSFPGDLRKDTTHRGGLVGSKIMKRSSSVISDSGIESEPSSVTWPLESGVRGRPPLDFSSEREIPQQAACHRPVHRSSLEGLRMESNGSLPSGGIQASLTSISSLPYEEDQQQRQLRKLTKSVSAPQISSPEDTEEEHALLIHHADAKSLTQDQDVSCQINRSSLKSNLDPEQPESSPPDTNSVAKLGSARPTPALHLSALSGVSEVLLLQDSAETARVQQNTVIGSQGENVNHQTHVGGVSAPVEDEHLVECEAVACGCGKEPCAHKGVSDEDRATTGDERQTTGIAVEDQEGAEPAELQGSSSLSDTTTQRPAGPGAPSFSEKELLDGQTKPSRIPTSGLAFMNKKMVEVVNMSVSCAPTCLPFSSVLRDSPSIGGLSARQAASPITHQPLGSFGIISSSSLNALNMDDETNERMLK